MEEYEDSDVNEAEVVCLRCDFCADLRARDLEAGRESREKAEGLVRSLFGEHHREVDQGRDSGAKL